MGTDKAGLKHKSDFDNQASTLSQLVLCSDPELSQTGKRGNGGGGGSATEQPVQAGALTNRPLQSALLWATILTP